MAFAFNPPSLEAAIEGYEVFTRQWEEIALAAEPEVDATVRFLRGIPAEDMAKKRELAAYFETERGQRYSSAERKAAYDDLLGTERNRETIG